MRAVIQRVKYASVTVDDQTVGRIDKGFLILLGVGKGDTDEDARLLYEKIAKMRIFEDENGKMNRSLSDVGGEILLISNFTLLANCRHGNRPDFFSAMEPSEARRLYELFCDRIAEVSGCRTERGVFGADMKVELLNDGPVTIVLDSSELKK